MFDINSNSHGTLIDTKKLLMFLSEALSSAIPAGAKTSDSKRDLKIFSRDLTERSERWSRRR